MGFRNAPKLSHAKSVEIEATAGSNIFVLSTMAIGCVLARRMLLLKLDLSIESGNACNICEFEESMFDRRLER